MSSVPKQSAFDCAFVVLFACFHWTSCPLARLAPAIFASRASFGGQPSEKKQTYRVWFVSMSTSAVRYDLLALDRQAGLLRPLTGY